MSREVDPEKWLGVDFDGTLAATLPRDSGPEEVGEPVWPMVYRVIKWLDQGWTVKILTARNTIEPPEDRDISLEAVRNFCQEHFGQTLEITNCKDQDMEAVYDDRAVSIEDSTGRMADLNERPD